MTVTDEMMDRIDRLAELETVGDEKERTRADLQEMIAYVRRVSDVDTTGVEPMIQPFDEGELPLREDGVHETDGGQGLRANAPLMREDMVVTPRSI